MDILRAPLTIWPESGLVYARHETTDTTVILAANGRRRGLRERVGPVAAYALYDDGSEVYVGVGDYLDRSGRHWTDPDRAHLRNAALIVVPEGTLSRHEWEYLESRLYERVLRSSSPPVPLNAVPPTRPSLPASRKIAVESRLDLAIDLLLRLRVPFLRDVARPLTLGRDAPVFEFENGEGLRAEGYFLRGIAGPFVLRRGALVRRAPHPSLKQGIRTLTEELKGKGVLVDAGPYLVTLEDVSLRTPSTGTCLVAQSELSGRRAWRVRGSGETLGEWQDRRNYQQVRTPRFAIMPR